MKCPICQADVSPDQNECLNCGALLEKGLNSNRGVFVCLSCGSLNPLEARFCTQCGEPLAEQTTGNITKENIVSPEIPQKTSLSPSNVVIPTSSEDETSQVSPATGQTQDIPVVTPILKKHPVFIGTAGLGTLICLCLISAVNYGAFRSLIPFLSKNTLTPTITTTKKILSQSTKLQPSATMGTTPIISPSFTSVPTNTRAPTLTFRPRPTLTLERSEPFGKIVFSCQMEGVDHDQICIVNADGSDWRQLTDNNKHNWYASISPDGKSVVYSSNLSGNYEIYEISAYGGKPVQLTSRLGGKLYAPEISPDGEKIVYTHDDGKQQTIWIMNRDGSNPHRVSPDDGWDPSWTADGKQILFASLVSNGTTQLFVMDEDGSNSQKITSMRGLVGRSDWSPNGKYVATYAGSYGSRSIYLIPLNGSEPIKYFFKPTSAAPSFSPDGQWIAFTGYIDHQDDFDKGCEIYLARVDDPKTIIRLTKNNYCDWQPRWGS
jgi:TolB protein